MVECGICLEEYQEGDLELHREMCVVRLMFRCSLCNEDYVSKEGLWNHLDLHEIVDESKELNYQEIKAKHKLHQCVLCNDQRAYSKSSYWKHVQDIHDGFFLRCSDCGENFRSENLKNYHVCKARYHAVASDLNDLQEKQVPIEAGNLTSDAEHLEQLRVEQDSNSNKGLDNRLSEHLRVNLNTTNNADVNIIDKESELPTINLTKSKDLPSRFACDLCGMTFSSKGVLLHHQRAKYACMERRQQKCPHCRRKFHMNEYQAHFSLCEKKKFPCKLCPSKFETSKVLARHMSNIHRGEGVSKNPERSQIPGPEILVSADSSSSSNNFEERDISTTTKDIADKSLQLLIENPSSTSSGTKCVHCGKECTSATYLRRHILQTHRPTKCDICGIISEGIALARYHKIVKHTNPKHECAKCSRKFHIKNQYERHLKICDVVQSDLSSHKGPGELILKDSNDSIVMAENPSSGPSRNTCSHCGINESSADALACHILMHHDPVACDICGNNFSSLFQAQKHKNTRHKEPKLKCPHCSMHFSAKVVFQRHVRNCKNETFPCDFCGKMFANVAAATIHSKKSCRAYKKSKQQEQKNAETSPCDETDSSTTVMENTSTPLVEGGLSQTKCYYCNEEFSRPGYLIHHLKVCHELTKCDICGMTIIGIASGKNHKIKSHVEPKHECPTCGIKIHSKQKFNAHCLACEHKRYYCKLCGRTFIHFYMMKMHLKTIHPDESSLKNIQIVQDQKQDQNNELEMDITVEETTISARNDQELSMVNPSSKADASYFRSNEHALTNLGGGELMDSQVIDKDSPMVSVAPLIGSSEEQVISKKTSQPLDENLSDQPYLCNICGITLHRYSQINYHMQTKHTEGKYQCSHCSKKFHFKRNLDYHASYCAGLKHPCKFCGRRFKKLSTVKFHISRFHPKKRSLKNIQIGQDKKPVQDSDLKLAIAENRSDQPYSCNICGITLLSRHQIRYHKLTCPKHAKGHDDSQFGAKEISLIHDVKHAPTNSTIVLQDENIELDLEIKVEETMLQEHDYQASNEDPERSYDPILNLQSDPIDFGYAVVKTCSFKDVKSFVKNFEFGFSTTQVYDRAKGHRRNYRCSRVKSNVRPQCERKLLIFTSNVNEKSTVYAKGEHTCINAPPENLTPAKLYEEQEDIVRKLLTSGVPEKNIKKHAKLLGANISTTKLYYIVKKVSKQLNESGSPSVGPLYKCSFCPKKLKSARSQRRHEKSCLELQCNKCSLKFTRRSQLDNHNEHTHPHDGKSKDVEAEHAEVLENGIKVKEEYPEDEEEIVTSEHPNTAKSDECHEVPTDRNKSLVRHEVVDIHPKAAKKE